MRRNKRTRFAQRLGADLTQCYLSRVKRFWGPAASRYLMNVGLYKCAVHAGSPFSLFSLLLPCQYCICSYVGPRGDVGKCYHASRIKLILSYIKCTWGVLFLQLICCVFKEGLWLSSGLFLEATCLFAREAPVFTVYVFVFEVFVWYISRNTVCHFLVTHVSLSEKDLTFLIIFLFCRLWRHPFLCCAFVFIYLFFFCPIVSSRINSAWPLHGFSVFIVTVAQAVAWFLSV